MSTAAERVCNSDQLARVQEIPKPSGITDPDLLAAIDTLAERTTSIESRIDEFAESLPFELSKDAVVTQDVIDEQAQEVAGGYLATVPEFRKTARLFASLARPVKGAKEDDPSIALLDGIGECIFLDDVNSPRGVRRNTHSSAIQSQEVADFWEEALKLEAPEAIIKEVFSHIRGILDRFNVKAAYPEDENDTRGYRKAAENAIIAASEIDGLIDFDELRFVVATEIARIFDSKVLRDTFSSKRVNKSEASRLIADSRFNTAYQTAYYIDKVRNPDSTGMKQAWQSICADHARSRVMGIYKKEFKVAMGQLWALGGLYRSIEFAEKDFESIPAAVQDLTDIRNRAARLEAEDLAVDAIDALAQADGVIVQRSNDRIREAVDEAQVQCFAEEAAMLADYRCEVAAALCDRIESLPVAISEKIKATFTHWRHNGLEEQNIAKKTEQQLNELRPELDWRLRELATLDAPYELSNTQLRKRDTRLVGLAKALGDSMHGHEEALSLDAARAVVGLMLGVYTERTGQNATSEYLARCYLEDAQKLRNLVLELEFLGQPTKSGFLETIHLLDELVDSGVFDNLAKNPEFKNFEDFLLHYIIAKAEPGEVAIETEETITDAKADDNLSVPDVPVEAMKQAEYEPIKVFPPGASEGDIVQDYIQGIGESDLPTIEWERITRLIHLRDKFIEQNIDVKFIRTQHAGWQVLPFFVLEIRLPNTEKSVVVVESPVYGNATYIYREATNRPEWREVVQKRRSYAREKGAVPLVHVDGTRLDKHFVKIWNRVISELTIYQ